METPIYVSVRWWTQDATGGWWPSRERGFTIRLRELAAFAAGVAEAVELAEAHFREHGEPSRPGTL